MTPTDVIGRVIRQIRTERGLSLEKVGKVAGIGRANISRIENGFVAPHLDTLCRIAEGLGTSGWRVLKEAERVAREFEQREE